MSIVDAHLDLSYNVTRGRDVTRPAREQPIVGEEIASVGLPDLRAGGVGLVCATIFCQPNSSEHAGYRNAGEAFAQARQQLDWYHAQFEAGELALLRGMVGSPMHSADQMRGPGAQVTRIQAILLLEGGDAIRTPGDVQLFFDAGVRIVGLAWKRTRYAGGTSEPGPLSAEGKSLIAELDRAGMIHDLSHLSEHSFWQLLDRAAGPVIASHSNCRAIVGGTGNRHLSDDMIRAVIERGGVIGINFFDKFLLPHQEYGKRRATLDDVLAHIRHVCDLAGNAHHVGLGTDMDGGLGRQRIPVEIETSADLPRVGEALSAARFPDTDVRAILGANWTNLFTRALDRT